MAAVTVVRFLLVTFAMLSPAFSSPTNVMLRHTAKDSSRRQKGTGAVSTHQTVIQDNVIGGAIPTMPKITSSPGLNNLRNNVLRVSPEPTPSINMQATTTGITATTERMLEMHVEEPSSTRANQNYRSRSDSKPTPTHPALFRHLSPPSRYPLDHESCRFERTEVTVRRGGCRKRIQVGICLGTCLSEPEFIKKIPYVQYRSRCCRPSHSEPMYISMNDEECLQQRRTKGKPLRVDRPYKDIFLLSATSCECSICA